MSSKSWEVHFEGQLWIGTQTSGLNRFDPETNQFKHYFADPEDPSALQSGLVRDIQIDHELTLWVGTDRGLSEWHRETDRFITYQHNSEDARSLSGNRVDTIYQDASNVLWIGTYEGVDRWNYLSGAFAYYTQADGQLNNDVVVSLAQSEAGALWLGPTARG